MGNNDSRAKPSIGLVLFLTGLFAFTIIFMSQLGPLRPASALFPRFALVLLLILLITKSLTLVSPRLHQIFASTAAEIVEYRLDGPADEDEAAGTNGDTHIASGSPWAVAAWYILATAAVYLFGHRIAAPVVLFAFLVFYGRQKVWVSGLVAAGLWAFIYFAFEVGMRARLWEGIF